MLDFGPAAAEYPENTVYLVQIFETGVCQSEIGYTVSVAVTEAANTPTVLPFLYYNVNSQDYESDGSNEKLGCATPKRRGTPTYCTDNGRNLIVPGVCILFWEVHASILGSFTDCNECCSVIYFSLPAV